MRASRQIALRKYNHSVKGRRSRTKYNKSPKGRKALQEANYNYRQTRKWQDKVSRQMLRLALRDKSVLSARAGWPDALNIEQKTQMDYIRPEQWRRAALLHPTRVWLFFSKTHADAVRGRGRFILFGDYAKEIGREEEEWKELIFKETGK